MATNPNTDGICPVTPMGVLLPLKEARKIAEILTTIQQVAGCIGLDLIQRIDMLDGDPDLEGECSEDEVSRCTDLGCPVPADGPGCEIADAGENAWIEWQTMRGSQKRGPNVAHTHEDDEEDDPSGQYDEDYYTGPNPKGEGAGCPIADPGGCEHDGREEDSDDEREQMPNDVPVLKAYDLEGNYLGLSNLQSSFRTNGGQVRSADSGQFLITRSDELPLLCTPV